MALNKANLATLDKSTTGLPTALALGAANLGKIHGHFQAIFGSLHKMLWEPSKRAVRHFWKWAKQPKLCAFWGCFCPKICLNDSGWQVWAGYGHFLPNVGWIRPFSGILAKYGLRPFSNFRGRQRPNTAVFHENGRENGHLATLCQVVTFFTSAYLLLDEAWK